MWSIRSKVLNELGILLQLVHVTVNVNDWLLRIPMERNRSESILRAAKDA